MATKGNTESLIALVEKYEYLAKVYSVEHKDLNKVDFLIP